MRPGGLLVADFQPRGVLDAVGPANWQRDDRIAGLNPWPAARCYPVNSVKEEAT
jgi:hypothetical protein